MIFVYTSSDAGYAERCARQRIDKDHPDLDRSLDFARFDATQDSLTSVVEEASAVSFSGNTKAIILVNLAFLEERKRGTGQSEKDISSFIGYLKAPNPSTDLFVCVGGSLGRTPAGKALKAAAEVREVPFPQDEELVLLTMKLVADGGSTADRNAAQMIADRAGSSWWSLYNAVERLCLYTDHITSRDVEALVPRKLEDRIYNITEFLLQGRPAEAVKVYRDLRRSRDPLSILPFLFSDFLVYAQVNFLCDQGMSYQAVADSLALKPYRVKMVRQKTYGRLNYRRCVRILADLGRMETSIKFDLDDPDVRIEEFMLNFGGRYIRRGR